MTITEQVQLGSLSVPPLGIGTWQWGDSFVWGYRRHHDTSLQDAYTASFEAGLTFFDTAEMYGFGRSERLIGQFTHQHSTPPIIATKFMPLPWRRQKASLLSALRGSLKRLGVTSVDLYQIHWPTGAAPVETWAEALADAVQAGLTRAVGVSNYNADQMQRTHDVLARRGVALASNQVEYSLLERGPERDGLLAACQRSGVTLIAYSPLRKGVLTGRYTPDQPPPGLRGRWFGRDYLTKVQPLMTALREIGAAHGNKSPAQVALNWLMCKGALPIPGARNVNHVRSSAGALGWRLSADQVAMLDTISARV